MIVGYVVRLLGCGAVGKRGSDGVLWNGFSTGTLFKTRAAAQKSVDYSLAYARKHGFSWKPDQYRITRLYAAKLGRNCD